MRRIPQHRHRIGDRGQSGPNPRCWLRLTRSPHRCNPSGQHWGIGADEPPVSATTPQRWPLTNCPASPRRSAPSDIYDLDQLAQSSIGDRLERPGPPRTHGRSHRRRGTNKFRSSSSHAHQAGTATSAMPPQSDCRREPDSTRSAAVETFSDRIWRVQTLAAILVGQVFGLAGVRSDWLVTCRQSLGVAEMSGDRFSGWRPVLLAPIH